MTKTGGARVVFGDAAAVTYTGTTTISNGTLVVSATKTGGAGITVVTGGTLGGDGPITENVVFDGGGVSPGDADLSSLAVMSITGNVTMNSSSNNVFDALAESGRL